MPNIFLMPQPSKPKNDHQWYERADGTCKFENPTLINMGDDRPPNLFFPVQASEALSVLAKAKYIANELDALLVLLLYGEIADLEMASLILELADSRVLPLWVGEKNRTKFDRIVAILSCKG